MGWPHADRRSIAQYKTNCAMEVRTGEARPVLPVQNLIDYWASGQTLDEFLEDFPAVAREQAMNVLRLAIAADRCVFRPKPSTDSGAWRPVIPEEGVHRFR